MSCADVTDGRNWCVACGSPSSAIYEKYQFYNLLTTEEDQAEPAAEMIMLWGNKILHDVKLGGMKKNNSIKGTEMSPM